MSAKFVLATHNPVKLGEMREILSEMGLEVVSPDEIDVDAEVEETGETFEENATLKAKAFCAASGLPAIADDSGLCVDALNGGPGVYSARYGGENLSDAARNKLLLESVKGQGTRDAHFVCSIVCAFPNGEVIAAEGRCDGVISYIPMGQDGFGYDPIFNYPPKLKTFAQMTPEEKAEVSHRGKALRAFVEALKAHIMEEARRRQEAEEAAKRPEEAAKRPEEAAERPEDAPQADEGPEAQEKSEHTETQAAKAGASKPAGASRRQAAQRRSNVAAKRKRKRHH